MAQRLLFEKGFSRNEVSFVAGDTRGHQTPRVGPVLDSGAEVEAGRDAWVGGAVGLAAGAIAAVLPGIGALIARGPLAGAAAGGIIGLLKEYGVPEEEAQFYAEGVRRGGALLTVHDVSEEREAIGADHLPSERRGGHRATGERIRPGAA